jgi:hypothetical protein
MWWVFDPVRGQTPFAGYLGAAPDAVEDLRIFTCLHHRDRRRLYCGHCPHRVVESAARFLVVPRNRSINGGQRAPGAFEHRALDPVNAAPSRATSSLAPCSTAAADPSDGTRGGDRRASDASDRFSALASVAVRGRPDPVGVGTSGLRRLHPARLRRGLDTHVAVRGRPTPATP